MSHKKDYMSISDEICCKCNETETIDHCVICENVIDKKKFRFFIGRGGKTKTLCKKCLIVMGNKFNEILDFRGNDWLWK